ncbi:MAG: hypothetical protein Q9173_001685 [Seirophora scorigena]
MSQPYSTTFTNLFKDGDFTINYPTSIYFKVSGHYLCAEDVWMIYAARYSQDEHTWEDIAHALEFSGHTGLTQPQRVFYIDPARPPRRPIRAADVERAYNQHIHLSHHITPYSLTIGRDVLASFREKLMERFERALRWYDDHKDDEHFQ